MSGDRCLTLNRESVDSELIAVKQAQVDKLYAGLKDLAGERRAKLDEALQLFMLNREVDDLEQWIAERELVAGSHELGQDYDHVTVSGSLSLALSWSSRGSVRLKPEIAFISLLLIIFLACTLRCWKLAVTYSIVTVQKFNQRWLIFHKSFSRNMVEQNA